MHRHSQDIILILPNHPPGQSILGKQDHSQLRPSIPLRRPQALIIDLLQARKMHILWRPAMHLARLKYHPRLLSSPTHPRRLPQHRPQQINHIKLPQIINPKMPINPIPIQPKLIRINPRRQNQIIQPLHPVPQPPKNVPHHPQIPRITLIPLDLGTRRLSPNGGLRVLALLLPAVDHDDAAAGVGEGARHFEADAEGAADDDGHAPGEVVGVDGLRAEAGGGLED
jgi:hypothetical protein